MGKWITALSSIEQKSAFGGFGCLSTGCIHGKKPDSEPFGGFGGCTTGHIPENSEPTEQPEEEPDNRVRCCDCQQTRCPYPLAYGRHSSEQPRWCNTFTPAWSAKQ